MTNDDDAGEFDATMDSPVYQLLAAVAQMYLDGGYDLDKDAQTAGGSVNPSVALGQLRFFSGNSTPIHPLVTLITLNRTSS